VAGTRRLAAIMFTDMVGFTASAQSDESMALDLLREQEDPLRPLFIQYPGREVKSTGDGFLVEFDSALRAVQCAIGIQRAIAQHDSLPGTKSVLLRIGVHLGDVEERGTDIFGDSVNLASRIEPLADPGGICITEPVFGQVRNKISERIEKLGPANLKNVTFPIDGYRVALGSMNSEQHLGSSLRSRLAILPLVNISPDPNDAYFAGGLTEELIPTLSKDRELRVIARTLVSQYKATSMNVTQIGTELGVGSVLEGSIRKDGNRLRITLQLIDSSTQEHIWANIYDRELDDVFGIQRDIAEHTAVGLKVGLLGPERASLEKKPTSNYEAYELYLKGTHAAHLPANEARAHAIKLSEQAIQ
jgi:adenylate cyclase